LRVLERRAEKGKFKSHVDDLKNKNNQSGEEPEQHDKTEKRTLNSHLRLSPFARFCKADEALHVWKSDGEAHYFIKTYFRLTSGPLVAPALVART